MTITITISLEKTIKTGKRKKGNQTETLNKRDERDRGGIKIEIFLI